MKHLKYKVTKDGMFLIHLKTGKKIAIPSPIKLRDYAGLRTQLEVGTKGHSKPIIRSCIDESEFTLGEPAAYSDKKKNAPKAAGHGKATPQPKAGRQAGRQAAEGWLGNHRAILVSKSEMLDHLRALETAADFFRRHWTE